MHVTTISEKGGCGFEGEHGRVYERAGRRREQAYYFNYIVISLKRAITFKMLKVICCIIIKGALF